MTVKERIETFCNFKKISMREFERLTGLNHGYVNTIRKGIGNEKLAGIMDAFPDLSRDWLLYGEGEMLKIKATQSVDISGSENSTTTIAGSGNEVLQPQGCLDIEKFLNELAAQRELTEKALEQCNRLQDQNFHLTQLILEMKK